MSRARTSDRGVVRSTAPTWAAATYEGGPRVSAALDVGWRGRVGRRPGELRTFSKRGMSRARRRGRDGKGGWRERRIVGSGWNVFTAIVGVGDFTGGGHPDVLARDSTGLLWLYPGDGKGGWLPRSNVGSGWNVMSLIIGAGDFDGDSHPDVLAREGSGLWLYPGSGTGGWLARVKVGTGWEGFSAVVGAGSMNGDRHPDLLARDAAGALILYPGDGRGSWLVPSVIGSGWGSMTALF